MSVADICHTRTTWGIVSSCLTTIFACTWAAVHPNIPGPNETSFEVAFSHLGITLVALIAPELVIFWAMKQWFCARRIAKRHSANGWTKTHGFFILMGGFVLVQGTGKAEVPLKLILPKDLKKLAELPPVTEAQIQDKGKRDALSKGVILVQTMWFILQCLGCAIENLPITELEIATLAFTVLNLATYWFWWDKPVDVRCPYPVHELRAPDGSVRGGQNEVPQHDDFSGQWSYGEDSDETTSWPERGDIEIVTEGEDKTTSGPEGFAARISSRIQDVWSGVDYGSAPSLLRRVLITPNFVLMTGFLQPFFSLRRGKRESLRVPTFYAGTLNWGDINLIAWISALITSVFGAIHCLAWSLPFPSHTQQLIWRVCAVAISSLPLLAAGTYHYMYRRGSQVNQYVFFPFITTICLTYLFARITILVLTFRSLRTLPPGAFETVYWTTFIPHL
ncbi:hypothetical protein JAAARDRAFT_692072 [Jaapia argillacea MUCL 33604]|uniref:Uncharacterized protein n=1 Tax=Jaapia argillacea MUCL 33604 TaxID=933084 RepID=A0A067PKG4_9AGAM|nr:hypothetical protein JAAARDRAFT_692072 [Jaapia argillacea MUCL 33604]